MAKNRMTFEKSQREMKKKRKAAEKRAIRKQRKEQAQEAPDPGAQPNVDDEAVDE